MNSGGPRRRVYLRLQGVLELVVGVVVAGEVGVADEEALPVVVRVNEPTEHVFGAVLA